VGGAAFPAANITIYDMNNGTGENRLSTAGYKAENFPGISIVTDTAIDGGDGALSNRKYASTLKAADYLINVFGARGHDIPPDGSKFSMGFKSHYGTYADPDPGLHQDVPEKLRAINTSGPVYNKQVLSVCVGIFGTNEGKGPQGAADVFSTYSKKIDASSTCLCPATVVMSTDPISAEVQSIKILRLNKAASFATADLPGYLKSSAGIDVAGLTPTHNLGTIDETQMDIRRIMNGQIIAVKDPTARLAMGGIMVSAHQVQGHSTFIDFAVPSDHLGKQAKIEIFDAKGSLARTFSQKVMGIRNNVSWDEKDSKGNMVAKGMYVVRLSSGTVQEASQFSIMR
jgi:hypothetical protein